MVLIFLRYYAVQAEKISQVRQSLPGPTGETNDLFYEPKGVFVCISPWNFPVAIFIGQIAAALITGNSVLYPNLQSTLPYWEKLLLIFFMTVVSQQMPYNYFMVTER